MCFDEEEEEEEEKLVVMVVGGMCWRSGEKKGGRE